jgi:hypothetical protein
VFATDDKALIEITNASFLRVWVDDELLTVPSVSTTVTNGDFSSSAVGWTLTATSGRVLAHQRRGAQRSMPSGHRIIGVLRARGQL